MVNFDTLQMDQNRDYGFQIYIYTHMSGQIFVYMFLSKRLLAAKIMILVNIKECVKIESQSSHGSDYIRKLSILSLSETMTVQYHEYSTQFLVTTI